MNQRLPNAEAAWIPDGKLRAYALNATHPDGRHKARVFAAALALTADHAEWLAQTILELLPDLPATQKETTSYQLWDQVGSCGSGKAW